jgi:hypothetical protein
VVGSSGYGNEPSDLIKREEYLDQLNDNQILKER